MDKALEFWKLWIWRTSVRDQFAPSKYRNYCAMRCLSKPLTNKSAIFIFPAGV
jgi:hypothetical protein